MSARFDMADLHTLFRSIKNERRAAPITIHHPDCACFRTENLADCSCGGSAFPVASSSVSENKDRQR